MDSLLANYVASDEEEEQEQEQVPAFPCKSVSKKTQPSSKKTSSFFSSLPQPKSSSALFQSFPQPKQILKGPNSVVDGDDVEEEDSKPSSIFSHLPQPKQSSISSVIDGDGEDEDSKPPSGISGSASIFSSLPQPKSQIPDKSVSNLSSSGANTKRVVQFKPPINPSLLKSSELDDEDDDDVAEKERRRRKDLDFMAQTSSVKSFLSSIPAPRNSSTLGVQQISGSGRRSILETERDIPASNSDNSGVENNVSVDQNAGNYPSGIDQNSGSYVDYNTYGNYHQENDQNVGFQPEYGIGGDATSYYGNGDTYPSYSSYGDYGQYSNNWVDGPDVSRMNETAVKVSGKRGRNEIPAEIIEVNQDELIKNRPREDQVKLTGIAFGPSYQPASTKGKPSKLHKRKHQIGTLFYDLKQKEMELAERRAKGFLTKAETQAKYGW
ncbi:Proline-rich PRCC [Quillaja saponaria]|uniref:Proline-rich PRCC n=1 Tax=Quillaja saponaria TaxID=32244 RepID=A0AAD7QDB4_QUISA|nr:Proline-rich PRCC [Quillaja saponaria]